MIAARFIPRLAVWAQAGTNQEFFDLETLYLGIFVIVGGMAGLVGTLRSKLVLTQQGVWLIGLKTRFFRWNEITAVRVRTYGLNGLMRHVWLVRGDKSTLARVPIDVWGMRDRLFDHKVRSIQEWHARLGSPDPWWLDRR